MKKEETKKEAVPVMKRLARTMSKEELAAVSGAGGPSTPSNYGGFHDIDYQN